MDKYGANSGRNAADKAKVTKVEVKYKDGDSWTVYNPQRGWKKELDKDRELSKFLDATDGMYRFMEILQ